MGESRGHERNEIQEKEAEQPDRSAEKRSEKHTEHEKRKKSVVIRGRGGLSVMKSHKGQPISNKEKREDERKRDKNV